MERRPKRYESSRTSFQVTYATNGRGDNFMGKMECAGRSPFAGRLPTGITGTWVSRILQNPSEASFSVDIPTRRYADSFVIRDRWQPITFVSRLFRRYIAKRRRTTLPEPIPWLGHPREESRRDTFLERFVVMIMGIAATSQ